MFAILIESESKMLKQMKVSASLIELVLTTAVASPIAPSAAVAAAFVASAVVQLVAVVAIQIAAETVAQLVAAIAPATALVAVVLANFVPATVLDMEDTSSVFATSELPISMPVRRS